MSEKWVKKRVKEILNDITNLFYYCPVPSGFGKKGIPDFIIVYQGIPIGLETKTEGRDLSLSQRQVKIKWEGAGGFYLIVDESNVKELSKILNRVGQDLL